MQFTALLPTLIGIALGRNPSGFLKQSFAAWGPIIRRRRAALFGGIGLELLVWFLAFRHTISNWTFTILTALLVVLLPRVGGARWVGRIAADDDGSVPLE